MRGGPGLYNTPAIPGMPRSSSGREKGVLGIYPAGLESCLTLALVAQDQYFRRVQLGALASQLSTVPVPVSTMGLTGLSGFPGHRLLIRQAGQELRKRRNKCV